MKKRKLLRLIRETLTPALVEAAGNADVIQRLRIDLEKLSDENRNLRLKLTKRPAELVPREHLETVARQRDELANKLHSLVKPIASP